MIFTWHEDRPPTLENIDAALESMGLPRQVWVSPKLFALLRGDGRGELYRASPADDKRCQVFVEWGEPGFYMKARHCDRQEPEQ